MNCNKMVLILLLFCNRKLWNKYVYMIYLSWNLFCRDCTLGQGQLCKGDAVNFGGWNEFTKKNGLFEFPNGKSL
jgi:hypothetical protein